MKPTIFFDMDGTLLDTEKYFRIFWKQAAKECGYEMSDEQALSLRSLGRPFNRERVMGFYQDETAYDKIRRRRMELMNEKLEKDGIPLKPYAAETLAKLQKRGYCLAVATATDLERTEKYLEKTGLRAYFDHLICATMVEKGKPAPDVYLYACQQAGVLPKEAYAVEDSPNGVLSAYRAGCRVIMIPDQTEPDGELAALLTARVSNLAELMGIFR